MNDESRKAMEVAEDARQTEWHHPSYAAELFLGNYRPELIFPYIEQEDADRQLGDDFIEKLETYIKDNLDPDELDRTREFPEGFVDGLKELGAFGIKIDKEYEGLGLSQSNYVRAISRVASYDASLAVLLSAHQSIGVPVPLKHFGSDEQKKKYLPLLAKGALSAFALTEVGVGSDPARMELTATPSSDGKSWTLNGRKLWCTNGTKAEYLVVMAKSPSKMIKGRERTQISAFLVDTKTDGFSVTHRCDFMGLKGIYNGVLDFDNVVVPSENLLGNEGEGLKLALTTLNTGRLTLPAASLGVAKECLRIARLWGNKREQWGSTIAKHEAVAEKLARMSSDIFAMEAVTWMASALVDKGGYDIRIEAAIAKLFGSEAGLRVIDDALQIRGGRGYETAPSLKARGEEPWPIERMYRDNRINTLIEGSSEIMHLFLAREALDPHMKVAGALAKPGSSLGAKISAALSATWHYIKWYPTQWLPNWLLTSQVHITPRLRGHGRFIARKAKKLSRAIFHAMVLNGPALEKRQITMSRLVDIGLELYVMSTVLSKATSMIKKNPSDTSALDLADYYCTESRERVNRLFSELHFNSDRKKRKLAKMVREGECEWLEEGVFEQNP